MVEDRTREPVLQGLLQISETFVKGHRVEPESRIHAHGLCFRYRTADDLIGPIQRRRPSPDRAPRKASFRTEGGRSTGTGYRGRGSGGCRPSTPGTHRAMEGPQSRPRTATAPSCRRAFGRLHGPKGH